MRLARSGDVRAQSGITQLDAGTKSIHAAYKDFRRRDRYSADFRPTPYDVWSFRHDRAFGIPHPGAIPPAIVAHTLHYFTLPDALVVDPMAGGGTTLDVCQSMGRRCLAYDLHPARPEIRLHDIRHGFPAEAAGCDLIFCDPPYHTMLGGNTAAIASPPLHSPSGLISSMSWPAMPLRPYGPAVAWLCSWPPKPKKTFPLASATSITPFLATSRLSARASSPSVGSVAPWTAPIFPSTSGVPAPKDACSARFAISW